MVRGAPASGNSGLAGNEHFLWVMGLKRMRYFWRQPRGLAERFPEGKLRNVADLMKRVDRAESEANDRRLTPDRSVGVAPLDALDAESVRLAARTRNNFEKPGT